MTSSTKSNQPNTTGFHVHQGHLRCDEILLSEIAAVYETPCYVYSKAFIEQQLTRFSVAFADLPVTPCYAAKANTNPAILELIANFQPAVKSPLQWGIDAVSGREIAAGIDAGFDRDRMIFSGVGKRQEEIEFAINQGVTMNVESLFELHDIIQSAEALKKQARIGLRVNPDVDAKTHPKITTGTRKNKFGMSMPMVHQALDLANKHPGHINLAGLSIHIGSQITDVRAWSEAALALVRLTDDVHSSGRAELEFIDFGGGFPIRYRNDAAPPDIATFADAIRTAMAGASHPATKALLMLVEPGRWVIAEAGGLLTSVMGVKGGPEEGLKERFIVVDASMTELLRPALYDACHDITFESAVAEEPDTSDSELAESFECEVVGPVCESSDVLGSQVKLPGIPHKKQLALIHQAGAYGYTMASHYNQRPLPPEILIEKNRSRLIRPRQIP